MDILNKAILGGFFAAGLLLIASWLFPSQLGFLVGHAVFLGWLLVYLAVIVFFISAVLYSFGRIGDYWRTLYPVNFGLALLGWAFITYNAEIPSFWIAAACTTAVVVAFALYKSGITKSKWSKWIVVLLIVPLLAVNVIFWMSLMVGLIFISLALLSKQQTIKGDAH